MDVRVMDKDFNSIYVVEQAISILWNIQYQSYGDFEVFSPVTPELLMYATHGNYMYYADIDSVCVIEDITIETHFETGDRIIIKGRTIESVLARRIVLLKTSLAGSLQDGVERLVTEAFINPTDPNRKVNMRFKKSMDPIVTDLKIDSQYTYKNLHDVIADICAVNQIGFRISTDILTDLMTFELYSGVDRTSTQIKVPYVLFSPTRDNLISSKYVDSRLVEKTVALVGGAGEDTDRILVYVGDQTRKGLDRDEMFVDARDLQPEELSDSEYRLVLAMRGKEKMLEADTDIVFEGEVDFQSYKYGRDYSLGDLVEVENRYGIGHTVFIKSVLFSLNTSQGFKVIPSFVKLEEKEE